MRPSDNPSMLRRPRENWLKSQGGKKDGKRFPPDRRFLPVRGNTSRAPFDCKTDCKAGLGSHMVYY